MRAVCPEPYITMRGTSVYKPVCSPSSRHTCFTNVRPSRSSLFTRFSSNDAKSSAPSVESAGSNAAPSSGVVISEDVLARLRAAEEEAERLRQQLAAVQGSGEVAEDPIDPPRRIDGGDLRRETLFVVKTERRNWLSEADVDFFTADAKLPASGAAQPVASDEEKAVVTRRLLIGIAGAIGVGAFALVPTSDLRRPTKPLSFYVVALLRVQSLLKDLEEVISNGEWGTLSAALSRINGPPNNIRDSLYSAAALLPNSKTQREAENMATEILDFLVDMDYNKYFDAMPKAVTGKQQAEFATFSNNARAAALKKLDEFILLIPADERNAAVQLSQSY